MGRAGVGRLGRMEWGRWVGHERFRLLAMHGEGAGGALVFIVLHGCGWAPDWLSATCFSGQWLQAIESLGKGLRLVGGNSSRTVTACRWFMWNNWIKTAGFSELARLHRGKRRAFLGTEHIQWVIFAVVMRLSK